MSIFPVFSEAPCTIVEKLGPGRFGTCPMPATHRATAMSNDLLCEDHTILALIAGWKPEPISLATLQPPDPTEGSD